MEDRMLRQWEETADVLREARELGDLVRKYAARAMRGGSKDEALMGLRRVRAAVLAMDDKCEACGVDVAVDVSTAQRVTRLCAGCGSEHLAAEMSAVVRVELVQAVR
jgi:hypothetical protein